MVRVVAVWGLIAWTAAGCRSPDDDEAVRELIVSGTVVESRAYTVPASDGEQPRLSITVEPDGVAWADGRPVADWQDRLVDHLDPQGRVTFVARGEEAGGEAATGARIRLHLDDRKSVKALRHEP